MSKGTVKDPSIAIKPNAKLHEFIKTLTDPDLELPVNILKLYVALTGDKTDRKTATIEIPISTLTKRDEKLLDSLSKDDNLNDNVQTCLENLTLDLENEIADKEIIDLDDATLKSLSKNEAKKERAKARDRKISRLVLSLNDLKWLSSILAKQRDSGDCSEYLHELLEGAKLILPQNEIIVRNPVLEARCQRLRREQEDRKYHAMTKNVDNNRRHAPDDTIGYQIKQINRQLIGVAQFIFSVMAGFAFGFLGLELIIGQMDFGFRLLLGIICALVIAIAEIYFLAKKLNEDLDYAEKKQELLRMHKIGISTPASGKEHVE